MTGSVKRCHQAPETVNHILQQCNVWISPIPLPQDATIYWLSRAQRIASERNPDLKITREKLMVSPSGQHLRPDIVVEDGNDVRIIDVAVTWDTSLTIFRKMCRHKQQKYECLKPLLLGKAGTVWGMAFGACSMLCQETVEVGRAMGLLMTDLRWLSAKAPLGSAIILSRFRRQVVP